MIQEWGRALTVENGWGPHGPKLQDSAGEIPSKLTHQKGILDWRRTQIYLEKMNRMRGIKNTTLGWSEEVGIGRAAEHLRTTEEKNSKGPGAATRVMCDRSSPTHLAPPCHASPSEVSCTSALTCDSWAHGA